MNRITQIAIKTHCNDLGGKVWNPAIRWTKKFAVFVELHDGDGITGLGECWCFDSHPDALIAFIRTELAPHFIGRDLDELSEISAQRLFFATLSARHGILASALSGFDMAIWDILAQKQGVPIWQYLNPKGPAQALLYASGGLYGEDKSPEDLSNEMAELAARFGIVKMKIGALALDEDLTRVNAVLAKLPSHTRLIIDCVYRYDYDTFWRIYDQFPHYRIEAIQSPLAASDYKEMARLVAGGIPVMANEAEYRHELHRELIERRAVRFLQVSPVACGGYSRLNELAQMTNGTPIDLSLEVSSTAVALTAATQFAASNHEVAHVEYHTIHDVFFDRLDLSRDAKSKQHRPPTHPGLGITLPASEITTAYELNYKSAS